MIWVRLFPGETAENLARRVAGILALDLLSGGPPYWHADSQKWQLDRGNNWWLRENLDAPGWVRVTSRSRLPEQLDALAAALRVFDLREVSTEAPSCLVTP